MKKTDVIGIIGTVFFTWAMVLDVAEAYTASNICLAAAVIYGVLVMVLSFREEDDGYIEIDRRKERPVRRSHSRRHGKRRAA